MASLLPSELARLILGYLEAKGCRKASDNLLQELPELAECLLLRKRGYKVTTRIGSQSLEDMLHDYSEAKDHVMECLKNNSSTFSKVPRTGSLLQQIKSLTSMIIENKLAIKQGSSIGMVKKVKQKTRAMKLRRKLHGINVPFTAQDKNAADDLNATSAESLPGSLQRERTHEYLIQHSLAKALYRAPTNISGSSYHSPLSAPTPQGTQDARHDPLAGSSTSPSLAHQDLEVNPQKRKGIVKRRSCEQTPMKMSPVLDNEANFEKILKNLYENTALHEKIAENINRGLSTQTKVPPQPQGEGDSDSSLNTSNRRCKDGGGGGRREKDQAELREEVAGSSGDAAFLKELDHIVTGIISETTSDPAFEVLIDEVFGSPQSGSSKSNGPANSSQDSMQDLPSGPPRLLTTPVPPPNIVTPSSSLLHIPQTFSPPQSPTETTISNIVCPQPSSHNLSTPHLNISSSSDSSICLSTSAGAQATHTPLPCFAPSTHTMSGMLIESTPKKIQGTPVKRNSPHEKIQVIKNISKSLISPTLKDVTQKSPQSISPPFTRSTARKSNLKTSPLRRETADLDLSNNACVLPSASIIQKSTSPNKSSGGGGAASPPRPKTNSRKMRKSQRKGQKKNAKDDEKNLGEQLLKEFVDFQSSRPDKVGEQEAVGEPVSGGEHGVSGKDGVPPPGSPLHRRTKDQECANGLEEVDSEVLTLTTQSGPITQSSQEASLPTQKPQTNDMEASPIVSIPNHLVSPCGKNQDSVKLLETNQKSQLTSEKSHSTSSGCLQIDIHSDNTITPEFECKAGYENRGGLLTLASASTAMLPVMSTTIPGLANSGGSSCTSAFSPTVPGTEDSYTLTELAPMNPLDLPLLETPCSTAEVSKSAYSGILQTNTDTSNVNSPVPPSVTPLDPLRTPVLWNPSTAASPVGFLQESAIREGNDEQPPDVRTAEGDSDITTILLPPVSESDMAEGQIIMFAGGGNQNPETMILQLPATSPSVPEPVPPVPEPVEAPNTIKGRRRSARKTPKPRKAPVLIAPKQVTANSPVQVAGEAANGSHEEELDLMVSTTFTLPNNISFVIPGICASTSGENSKVKGRKKKPRKGNVKKKLEENQKDTTKPPKKTPARKRAVKGSETKRKVSKRGKPRVKQMQEELDQGALSNNIVATALSFALNSVSPEKDNSPFTLAESPTQDVCHSAPVLADVGSGEVVVEDNIGIPEFTAEEVQATTSEIDHLNSKSSDVENHECTAESIVRDTPLKSDGKSQHTTAKYNLARSSQLKALLQLSQSISPSKKSNIWKRAFPSEESPSINILQKRGSQSTPSRKNSHIRVLDFGTPRKGRLSGKSPRKAVISLRFSSPEDKKPHLRFGKSSLVTSNKFSKYMSPKKKILKNIVEEESVTERPEIEDVVVDGGDVKPQKQLPTTGSKSLLMLKQGNDNNSIITREGKSKENSPSYMSEGDLSEEQRQPTLLFIEDEESIVLHLDGEDSLSSSSESSPRHSDNVPLFDLPKQPCNSNSFNLNLASQSPCHQASLGEDNDSQDLFNPVTKDVLKNCTSRVKQMQTPCKTGEPLPLLNPSVSMMPVCLEPPTPLLSSEQRPCSLPCDDLNTPILPSLPDSHSVKTPLIKDYPQGPYSNSSVSTSYYMPSERSLTESEDYSPSKLDALWENSLSRELSSPTTSLHSSPEANRTVLFNDVSKYRSPVINKSTDVKKSAVHSPKCNKNRHTPSKSPGKLSRKVMGEIIEQEMSKLFSGSDDVASLSSLTSPNCGKSSGKDGGSSKDSVKGKQGRKKRVPSRKYRNLAESTCSEDEVDHADENAKNLNSHPSRKYRPLDSAPVSRSRAKIGTRDAAVRSDDEGLGEIKTSSSNPKSYKETQTTVSENNNHDFSTPQNINDSELQVCHLHSATEKQPDTEGTKQRVDDSALCSEMAKSHIMPRGNLNSRSDKCKPQAPPQGQSDVCSHSEDSDFVNIEQKKKEANSKSSPNVRHEKKEENSKSNAQSLSALGMIVFEMSSSESESETEDGSVSKKSHVAKNKIDEKRRTTTRNTTKGKKLFVKDVFGSCRGISDESDHESEIEERKVSSPVKSPCCSPSTESNKETQVQADSQKVLRRSQRSTRGRLVNVTNYFQPSLTRQITNGGKRGWGGRAGQGSSRGRGKRNEINVEEVTIEAIIENHTLSAKKPPEATVIESKKITGKTRTTGKTGRARNLAIKKNSPKRVELINSKGIPDKDGQKAAGNSLNLLHTNPNVPAVVGAQKKQPASQEVEADDGKDSDKEPQSAKLHETPLQPTQPFSSWGGGMKTPTPTRFRSVKPQTDNLRELWCSSLVNPASASDVNVTDTEDEGARVQLCQSTPQQLPQQLQSVKGVLSDSQSRGCARTISYSWGGSRAVPGGHGGLGNLGQVHNITPKQSRKRKLMMNNPTLCSESSAGQDCVAGEPVQAAQAPVSEGSDALKSLGPHGCLVSDQATLQSPADVGINTSENSLQIIKTKESELSKIQNDKGDSIDGELVTLCAEGNDAVESIPASSIKSLLRDKNLHELEKAVGLSSQEYLTNRCFSESTVIASSPLADDDACHDDSPPRSVESSSDPQLESEEHCLMSYTALPPTPEKKMSNICQTIVRNGKAMVAFPSPSTPLPSPCIVNKPFKDLLPEFQRNMDKVGHSAEGKSSVRKEMSKSCDSQECENPSQESSKKVLDLLESNEDLSTKEAVIQQNGVKLNNKSLEDTGTCGVQKLQEEISFPPERVSLDAQSVKEMRQQTPAISNKLGIEHYKTPKVSSKIASGQNVMNPSNPVSSNQKVSETKKSQSSGQLLSARSREEDSEGKAIEEEEDSDVLRIEEPSETENENDNSKMVLGTLCLRMTEFIDLFTCNIETKKTKGKSKVTVTATRQRLKAVKQPTMKHNPTGRKQPRQALKTSEKSLPKKRNIKNPNKTASWVLGEWRSGSAGERAGVVVGERSSSNPPVPPSLAPKAPPEASVTHARGQKRMLEGSCEGGRSVAVETGQEGHIPKKKRRITPIRIGEVELHRRLCKGRWKEQGGIKELYWSQNRLSTATRSEMPEGKGAAGLSQLERLGGGRGGVSERSVSSVSSVSPGRLLISESPRGFDSSPTALRDLPSAFSHSYVAINSPLTAAPSSSTTGITSPTGTHTLTSSHREPSLASCGTTLSTSDSPIAQKEKVEKKKFTHLAGHTYSIESETSREMDEDYEQYGFPFRQRRARHMTQELHRGGSLEIARSPDKQLALMTSHQEGGSLQLSEESLQSFAHTPPTPGKHLFVPPPPLALGTASSATNSSLSSSSHARGESINLPLKKRKEAMLTYDPVEKKLQEIVSREVCIKKFLDKVHQ